jgi:diguanylate cyclase (GGDEF)-like protein
MTMRLCDQAERPSVHPSANENERLATLYGLDLIGSGPEEAYERLCRHAADVFGVPTVLVSLVGEDRQWFKARCGFDADETPIDQAFCRFTIQGDDVLVVPDARLDSRFADNLLVTGATRIRFYAGAPLVLRPGIRLGTLCLLDTKPRDFNEADRRRLSDLACVVTDQIRLREATLRIESELRRRERIQAEMEAQGRELARRDAMFLQTERIAKVGGWEFDLRTARFRGSDEIHRIADLDAADEPSADRVLGFFPHGARGRLGLALSRSIRDGDPFDLELPFVTAKNRERWVRVAGETETDGDTALRIFGILKDITERKANEERMWRLSNHDALTGLPNRALFQDRLEQAVSKARRSGGMVALLLIDLDDFKSVNDSLSHQTGDSLLKIISQRLLHALRECDTVARLGGDEFAVIIPDLADAEASERLIARLQDSIAAPIALKGRPIYCRATIGVTLFPDHEQTAAGLLRNADIALYVAKTRARTGHALFTPDLRQAVERRVAVQSLVRDAIAADAVIPYYQPEVCFSTGAVSGFEALMRWRHPTEGIQLPGAIGSAFDDHDIAVALGRRMMDRVLADMRGWLDRGVSFGRIAINVAEAEFVDSGFGERLLEKMATFGVPASSIKLEVTETVFLSKHCGAVAQALRALHEQGIEIALDDFGTGYASLTHLKQFPVDRLKIDRTFIQDVDTRADNAAIVRAVIGLGHSLGITTVAEGIETPAQALFLKECGCDFGQGYLYAKPMLAARASLFLETWDARRQRQPASYRAASSGG